MNSSKRLGFDNEKYLRVQISEIMSRIKNIADATAYIEFGGKAYDDQHAARVLPGYDPNNKLYLLRELAHSFEIVLAVSARDLLKPRVRGDSQLFYDSETLRIVQVLRDAANINITHGVVTMWPTNIDLWQEERLEAFRSKAIEVLGIQFSRHGLISKYPSTSVILDRKNFEGCPKIDIRKKHILVFSPGGGSGKFSFCLSQIIHDFTARKNSVYMKFETFPVFKLTTSHPLNLAFIAATADLGNTLMSEGLSGLTTYDKDFENFQLLKGALRLYSPDPSSNPMTHYQQPSDMGVNRITDGFIDEQLIIEASKLEIQRRIARYKEEISKGLEYSSTMRHLLSVIPT